MSEIKSRYELIPVIMKGKLILFDNKLQSIISTASVNNNEEYMALIQESIELNRKEDDDALYLYKINEL